jgi:hypothetical protein
MTEDELYEGLSALFHPWGGMADMDLDVFSLRDSIDLDNEAVVRSIAKRVLLPALKNQPLVSRQNAEKAARYVFDNQHKVSLQRFFDSALIVLKVPFDTRRFMGTVINECFDTESNSGAAS